MMRKKVTIGEFKEALAKNYGRGYPPEAAEKSDCRGGDAAERTGEKVTLHRLRKYLKLS